MSDVALFNSRFNRDSFLNNIDSFLRTMPDFRPQGIRDQLLPKCHVLYFPMQFVDVDQLDHRESGLVFTTVISYYTDLRSFTRCGSVAEWLGRWTCDQQVMSSNPSLSAVECNPGQVVNTHLLLSSSSIIWYQPMGHFIFRWNLSLRPCSETKLKSERLKNGFRPSSD